MEADVTFRPMKDEDLPAVLQWFDDETFFYDVKDPSLTPASTLVQYLSYPESAFMLIETGGESGRKAVGVCDFIVKGVARVAEIDLRIAPGTPRALDVGVSALIDLIDHLLNHLNVRRVEKTVFDFDGYGHALCLGAGMTPEGRLRQRAFKYGRFWDVTVYAVLAGSWKRPSGKGVERPPYGSPGRVRRPLSLRRCRPEEEPAVMAVHADGWLLGDIAAPVFAPSRRDVERYAVARAPERCREAAVVERGEVAAVAVLDRLDFENLSARLRVGMCSKEWREEPYTAISSLREAARYAFGELGLRRLYGRLPGWERRGLDLCRRAGFVEEGRLSRSRYRGGSPWDVIPLGLLRDEPQGGRKPAGVGAQDER